LTKAKGKLLIMSKDINMLNALTMAVFLLAILGGVCFYLPRKRKQWRIQKWQKSLNLPDHLKIFQQLYQTVNGFYLSQQARTRCDAIDYTYGEIEFLPFIALLSLSKIDHNTVFYDLGCGVGKAVLACAMIYPVRHSVGVELLAELHVTACQQAKKLAALENYHEQAKKISFIHGDFLDVNLNDATFIFINSTALFNPTWKKICTRLENLPHLVTVITTSKPLPSADFIVIVQTQIEMGWGIVQAYIHQRKKRIVTNLLENIE
jgi:SAM-dependent methyltransferase